MCSARQDALRFMWGYDDDCFGAPFPRAWAAFPSHAATPASEVAGLKLNAEWVVLSARNTAFDDKPGAEVLSGLAHSFLYAGGRSLLVPNWVVDSESTVALMTGTFAAASDPKLSHAEALQKAKLAMIDNAQHPDRADPNTGRRSLW